MPERANKFSGWIAASVAAAALVLLALVAWVAFKHYVTSAVEARLDPEKIAFLGSAIPPGAATLAPPVFSDETTSASARAEREWERLGGDRLQAPQELIYSGGAALQVALEDRPDSILADSMRAFMRRADAFTTAVASLAARPDYAFQALPPASFEGAASGPNVMLADWGASLLSAQAKLDGDAGRWREALSRSVAAMRVAQPGEALYVSETHSVSLIAYVSSVAFAILARRCEDAAALRDALAALESLGPRLESKASPDPYASHFTCGLQRARAAGFQPKLSASPTGREIASEFLRWQWTLAPDTESAQGAQLRRAVAASIGTSAQWGEWVAALAVDMKLAPPDPATAYMANMPDGAYLRVQSRRARSSFDRLRLVIARRIFELENGRPPNGIDDIVPRYLPAAPIDPETGKPYDWERSVARFGTKIAPTP